LVLVDSTGSQLVNTYVPFGAEPKFTGDPETVKRMLASKGPVVSNLFVSLVAKEPVYNISIPVFRDGSVVYVISLGQLPGDLAQTLQRLKLNPSWTMTIWDRHGIVLARSRDHERFLAQKLPNTLRESDIGSKVVLRTTNLDGESVLLAMTTSKLAGWGISVSVPIAIAEAPLRTSIWLWGLASAGTIVIATLLGVLIGRLLMTSLSILTRTARVPIGDRLRDIPVSSVQEVNEVALILNTSRERQHLLLLEVSHRAKNMLAVVQALVTQSLGNDESNQQTRQLIIDRLHALARAHDALVAGNWSGIPLSEVVSRELAAFVDRVHIVGPFVTLKPDVVESMTLVLHELVTNAIKYGALSNSSGRISISWRVDPAEVQPALLFEWRESGGPEVHQPTKHGLGTRLLKHAFSGATSEIAYEPDGFVFRLQVLLAAVVAAQNTDHA
jgi:two-component sensor histidine kinase